MTLRTVAVPDPPAGQDWSYVVPGKYIENITSITARLTSGAGPITTAHDSSGHAQDGTYVPGFFPVTHVPGLVAGDLATDFSAGGHGQQLHVTCPSSPIGWAGDFSIECWLEDAHRPSGNNFIYDQNNGAGTNRVYWEFGSGPPNTLTLGYAGGFEWISVAGAVPNDGLPHHLVVTRHLNVVTFYVDGAAVANSVNSVAPGFGAVPNQVVIGGQFVGNNMDGCVLDEVAFYGTLLSPARVAAHHAAAAVSFAAYTAAVLADAPGNYYHLDDLGPHGQRTPELVITDQTNEVGAWVSGFTPNPATGITDYSWIVGLGDRAEGPGGTPISIPIPQLILPGGYVIETITPDLIVTDQWSQVTVWWNDDVMNSLQSVNPYVYPPGHKLVYLQVTAP